MCFPTGCFSLSCRHTSYVAKYAGYMQSAALAACEGVDDPPPQLCLLLGGHAVAAANSTLGRLTRCRPAALALRSKLVPSSSSTTPSSTTAKPTRRKSRDTPTRFTWSRARRASDTLKTTGCRGRATPLLRNSSEKSESALRSRRVLLGWGTMWYVVYLVVWGGRFQCLRGTSSPPALHVGVFGWFTPASLRLATK